MKVFTKVAQKILQYVAIDYNADHDYIESHEANQEPNPRYRHRSRMG